ncbi:MAG TPA: carboxypeptidase-like regulatory domain-containing protein, partial [Candidatus Saccharimonadales bacterium]
MPCGGCGCGGCSQTICVKDCTGAPVNGASITIKNGSTTIATGTTGDPSNCSVASTIRVAVGSGYTSVPTVSFSGGGGSGAAGIAVRSSGGAISAVTITNQGSGYSSAPTILFSGGGGSGANYTAVLGCGCVTLSLPSSGVYTVIVSSSSVNVTATLELSCSTITIGGFCANVNVLDCLISGLKVPGVTVTATGPSTSTNTYSAITDVNGCAIIPLPSSGTYTFSATYNGTTATYTGAAINGGTTDCASVIDITVTFANLCIRINGCFGIGNPLQGATVTVTGIGTV